MHDLREDQGKQSKADTMPQQPLVRLADLRIDPAQVDAYHAILAKEIRASVALEPGVLTLSAVTVAGRPDLVRILEIYADQQSYEAHLQTPHFLTYKTGTANMVLELTLLEATPLQLSAKAEAFT